MSFTPREYEQTLGFNAAQSVQIQNSIPGNNVILSHLLLYFSQRPRAYTDARVELSGRLQNSKARTRMCMQIPMSGAR
jgi:hypothetical protein